VEALGEAAQSFAAGDHEAPMSEAQLRLERARYFEEARKLAAEVRAQAESEHVRWNPPTGQQEIDRLRWFDYVHSDAPWESLGTSAAKAAPCESP
jgi:hypothetical protein